MSSGGGEGDGPVRLSVVTPSYQQAEYLEENLRSVPSDRRDDLEHVVVDGGSDDGTVELLERHARSRTLRWVSEPDEGQAEAYNKGLEMARGEWVGLQNSDDYYLPGAFRSFDRALEEQPGHDAYYANVLRVDAEGHELRRVYASRPSWFVHRFRGLTIRHQALFVRRSLLLDLGGFDTELHLALDFELVGRLLRSGASLRHVPEFWGAFRVQQEAKTGLASREEWRADREAALGAARYPGGRWTRPFWRAAAGTVQWSHIVADNGPGALLDRIGDRVDELLG